MLFDEGVVWRRVFSEEVSSKRWSDKENESGHANASLSLQGECNSEAVCQRGKRANLGVFMGIRAVHGKVPTPLSDLSETSVGAPRAP